MLHGNMESHEMFGLEFCINNDMECEILREVKDFLTHNLALVLNLEFVLFLLNKYNAFVGAATLNELDAEFLYTRSVCLKVVFCSFRVFARKLLAMFF